MQELTELVKTICIKRKWDRGGKQYLGKTSDHFVRALNYIDGEPGAVKITHWGCWEVSWGANGEVSLLWCKSV